MEAECACLGPPPEFLVPPPPRPPFLRDLTPASCAQSLHPDTCDVVAVLEARWHDDEALLSAVAAAACSLLLVALATAASILLWKYKRKKARAARGGAPAAVRPRPKDSTGLADEALDADAGYEDVIQMRPRRAPSNHYTREHRASRLHQYAEPLQVKATGSRSKMRRDGEEQRTYVCSLSRDGYGHVYQEIGHGLSGSPCYGEPPCLADERVAGLGGEPRPPTPDLCRHWAGAPPLPPPRPWSPPPGEPPPPYRTLPRRPAPGAAHAPAAYACVPLPSYAAAAQAPRSPPLGPPLSPPPPEPAVAAPFATHRRPSDRRRLPPHAAHLGTTGRRHRSRDLPPSW